MTTPSLPAEASRAPRSLRWLVLLIASALVHLAAYTLASGHLGMPSWRNEQPPVIMTELRQPPVLEPEPVAAAPKPKARRVRRAPPLSPPPPPPPVVEAETPSLAEAMAALAPTNTEAAENGQAGGEGTASDEQNNTAPIAESAPQDQAPIRYTVSPPPSAELTYDVQALRKGQTWHGTGVFRWETTSDSYRLSAEASVRIIFKFTVLNAQSEGRISDVGVAPVLYSETPHNKSMMNTHFQQENRKISFSASEAVYPYNGGEQDRISVIWQLAGIGRGDASQFAPGADIDVVVASTRNADTWRFRVAGLEDIDTPSGKVSAWHVTRTPRPGTRDRALDLWLAPQQEWHPVKVRHTYSNGDYEELSLASMAPLTPP